MATTTDATAQPSAEWDEAQCTTALAQLERLQTRVSKYKYPPEPFLIQQLDDLRLAIPRVLAPFYSPPTPAMYQAFKTGLTTSQNDIKDFRTQWHSDETQSIYQHARQSYKANTDLSANTQVQEYGWIEKEEKGERAEKHKEDGKEVTEEAHVSFTQNEIHDIVEGFRTTNSNISLTTKEDNHDLEIAFISASSRYRFHVIIAEEPNVRHKLNAECLGGTDPLAITRCIASRPQPKDLKFVLDMIGAYKTVQGKICAKCERMLDADANGTMARRRRQIVGPSETSETVWEAFHESCLK